MENSASGLNEEIFMGKHYDGTDASAYGYGRIAKPVEKQQIIVPLYQYLKYYIIGSIREERIRLGAV